MSDEYVRCVVEYDGDLTDLQQDGRAFIEATAIYRQLEDLRWEGVVQDVVYGSVLRDPKTSETAPLPVSFELRTDLVNESRLPEPGRYHRTVDGADRWTWEPLDVETFEQYRREQIREDGYDIFQAQELDMEVHTRIDDVADGLEEDDRMEKVTE